MKFICKSLPLSSWRGIILLALPLSFLLLAYPSATTVFSRSTPRSGASQPLATCAAVFSRHMRGKPAAVWPPVCPLPSNSPLRAAFEGPAGSMPISRDYCLAQRYEGAAGERVLDWSAAAVEARCAALASGTWMGSYAYNEVTQMRDALAQWTAPVGGAGLVMGSETPWVECLALAAGAVRVITWEFSRIVTDHPRLYAAPTKELARGFVSGALSPVDWVVSFSSLEHSGLGRYGDALNPDGDRDAMEEIFCMLRPGGVAIIGVPMTCARDGHIEFNAHRVYGWTRLAYIAEGFELVGFHDGCKTMASGTQSIVIFRRPFNAAVAAPLTADDFGFGMARSRAIARSSFNGASSSFSFSDRSWNDANQFLAHWKEGRFRTAAASVVAYRGSLSSLILGPAARSAIKSNGHSLFDATPAVQACGVPLQRFGSAADGGKLVCGMQNLRAPCIIYSLGSSNNFLFEEAALAETPCEIFTFDCTSHPPAKDYGPRFQFARICLGDSAKHGDMYKSLHEIAAERGHSGISFLKMDIEGYEYEVVESMWRGIFDNPSGATFALRSLPDQISLEVHFTTIMKGIAWSAPKDAVSLSSGDMLGLWVQLTDLGYVVVSREDNSQCFSCSEFTLVRAFA